MTPLLTHVPDEILLDIIEHVYVPAISLDAEAIAPDRQTVLDSRKALHSLCLTSRRLYRLAQPFLYDEFSIGYVDEVPSTTRYLPHQKPDDGLVPPQPKWDGRFMSFIKTLIARPDLAALVRRAFIHPAMITSMSVPEVLFAISIIAQAQGLCDPETFDSWYREQTMHPADWDENDDAPDSTRYNGGPDFALELPDLEPFDMSAREENALFDEDYLRYLVCYMMPNLQHVVIRSSREGGEGGDFGTFPETLKRLTSIEIHHRHDLGAMPFSFPGDPRQIKTLTIRGGKKLDYLEIRDWRYLTDLRIFDTGEVFVDLRECLINDYEDGDEEDQTIRRLERFHYHFTYLGNKLYGAAERNYERPSPNELILALAQQNACSLRSIYIDTRSYEPTAIPISLLEAREPIQSMEEFKVLDHLVLSADTIYTPGMGQFPDRALENVYPHILTRSLKSLRIIGWNAAVAQAGLLHLLRAIQEGKAPSLREVTVPTNRLVPPVRALPSICEAYGPRDDDELKRRFADLGIIFRVMRDPPHPPEIQYKAGWKKGEEWPNHFIVV